MAWYYILFLSVFAFFIIKTIISWCFGDTDIDFDCDGDVDFDISSMFSFKGFLHFLLGFSTYLAATARFDRAYDNIATYQFTWYHYLFATILGIIFMIGLFYLYKLMMKLNHSNDTISSLQGYDATILINNGYDSSKEKYVYTVNVITETGNRKLNICSDKENLKIGSSHPIYINNEGIYII